MTADVETTAGVANAPGPGNPSAGEAAARIRTEEVLPDGSDRTLQLPGPEAPPEDWAPVWDRLGRPKDAGGYDLRAPEGAAYDADAARWFRETAHAAGLSMGQAKEIHDAFLARFAPVSPAPAPDGQPPEDVLRQLWGSRFEANMASARRAYARFLGDAAPFHDIAEAIGETALMQLLAKVGAAGAEDSITARADAQGAGPRNPAEALAEIRRLQREAGGDPGHPYLSRMHPGHADAVRRMEALFALAYGPG